MRFYVWLDPALADALVAAAERDRRRPGDELAALAEAELLRRGLLASPELAGATADGGD